MKIKFFLFGIGTFIPGIFNLFARPTGGTSDSKYCYSVWLRHLVKLNEAGSTDIPKRILELGPGDSLGVGLAALLSGSDQYTALDVHKYSDIKSNLKIFDELIDLFKKREPIPNGKEFSRIRPELENYKFPFEILSNKILNNSLNPDRVLKIRNAIISENKSIFNYLVPWTFDNLKKNHYDYLLAQASFEYVQNMDLLLKNFKNYLSLNSYLSTIIDYSSHHLSDIWNEHWTCSDLLWYFFKGKQPHFLNRLTHDNYISYFNKYNYEILINLRKKKKSQYSRFNLSHRFRNISEEDLNTSGGFFVTKVNKTND
jgi:hypothetical protein